MARHFVRWHAELIRKEYNFDTTGILKISASPPTRRGSGRRLGGRDVGPTTPTRPLPRPTSPRGGDSSAVSDKVCLGEGTRPQMREPICLATFPASFQIHLRVASDFTAARNGGRQAGLSTWVLKGIGVDDTGHALLMHLRADTPKGKCRRSDDTHQPVSPKRFVQLPRLMKTRSCGRSM